MTTPKLIQAIEEGNVELALEFIDSGMDINVVDNDGHSPLVLAYTKGLTRVVNMLHEIRRAYFRAIQDVADI